MCKIKVDQCNKCQLRAKNWESILKGLGDMTKKIGKIEKKWSN